VETLTEEEELDSNAPGLAEVYCQGVDTSGEYISRPEFGNWRSEDFTRVGSSGGQIKPAVTGG